MTPSSLNNLTDAEINERIAEACGWCFIHLNEGSNYWSHIVRIDNPDGKAVGGFDGDAPKFKSGKRLTEYHERKKQDLDRAGVPDYLNDLNAMHEAEMAVMGSCENNSFPFAFADKYVKALQKVIGGVPGCFDHHCASARQRAEAFLATITP